MLRRRRRRALRGGGAAARRDAHRADAARSPAEDGDGRARAPRRVRPEARPGRRRRSRCSRCAAAASSSASSSAPKTPIVGARDGGGARGGAPAVLRAARRAAGGPRAGRARTSARRSRAGCRSAPAAACASSCRSAARSAASSISRTATRRSPTRRGSTRRPPRSTTRSRRCSTCSALPALPRRIECFDISTIQGSETVASMVVCEDGRMRRGEYRKFRIRGSGCLARPGAGSGARGLRAVQPAASPESPAAVHDDFAAMHEVVLRRYRKLLEQGGPFPDLIADRRRQGPAVGGVRGARGARARESRRGRHREEGRAAVHARSRGSDRARRQRSRRCCCVQRIRDEAHRFAVTFHRRARDDARSAIGARRRAGHRSAPAADAADDVRQPGRRAARDARGAGGRRSARKVADAVLAFFASRP